MKQIKEILSAVALIFLCSFLGVLLHGLFSCENQLPQGLEGGEVLNSFTVSDSETVLYRSTDGEVFLLEYQKNWLLPRQELKECTRIDVQPFRRAVTSAMTAYPVTATWEALTIDNQPDIRLRWGDFCSAYGTEILLLLLAAYLMNAKTLRKQAKKEEEHHV